MRSGNTVSEHFRMCRLEVSSQKVCEWRRSTRTALFASQLPWSSAVWLLRLNFQTACYRHRFRTVSTVEPRSELKAAWRTLGSWGRYWESKKSRSRDYCQMKADNQHLSTPSTVESFEYLNFRLFSTSTVSYSFVTAVRTSIWKTEF